MDCFSDEIWAEIMSYMPLQDVCLSLRFVNDALHQAVWLMLSR